MAVASAGSGRTRRALALYTLRPEARSTVLPDADAVAEPSRADVDDEEEEDEEGADRTSKLSSSPSPRSSTVAVLVISMSSSMAMVSAVVLTMVLRVTAGIGSLNELKPLIVTLFFSSSSPKVMPSAVTAVDVACICRVTLSCAMSAAESAANAGRCSAVTVTRWPAALSWTRLASAPAGSACSGRVVEPTAAPW